MTIFIFYCDRFLKHNQHQRLGTVEAFKMMHMISADPNSVEIVEGIVNKKRKSTATENADSLPNQQIPSTKQFKQKFDATLELLEQLEIEPESVYGHTIIDKIKMQTLLHYVSEKGHANVLKELLQQKCNLNCRAKVPGSSGCTPLHFAAWHGNDNCLKLLIKASADVNCTDDDLWTPLHYAALHKHFKCLKTLISHRATMNAKDKWNMTPLHSSTFGGLVIVTNELILNGSDVNAQDNFGNTALHFAAACGKLDCLKALIKAGANLHLKTKRGETALDKAILNKELDCVKYLEAPKNPKTCRIS